MITIILNELLSIDLFIHRFNSIQSILKIEMKDFNIYESMKNI